LEKDLNDLIVAGLLSALIVLLFKVLWDWLKGGRIEKERYLTVEAFNDHRKECCAISLKREFNNCQQEACTDQAKNEGRLSSIEEKLRDGQITFQSLNKKMDEKFDIFSKKFDNQNQILSRIQTVIEFVLEKKERHD